jgi:2-amino-4-hydroxy-6-hydroxymethyldihydropteridine diphosphokinase
MHVADQPPFLNAAALVRSRLQPRALLCTLKELERKAGREQGALRWGPRVLDIDIVWHHGVTMALPELTLPHPRWAERPFVLIPMNDVLEQDGTALDVEVSTALATDVLVLLFGSCRFVI